MRLAATINSLASTGIAYTERQLYYAFCRDLLPAPLRAALARMRWAPFTLPTPITFARFARMLEAWRAHHGTPPGLLAEALPATAAPPVAYAPDLDRYALPKALICQDAAIAAMLRANGALMELGCPILAAPDPLSAPIAAGLARAPAGRALLLHDASAAGLQCAAAYAARLPANVRLVGLGLRPAHAARMHLFVQRERSLAPNRPLPHDLTGAERRRLAGGWTAEVAAVPPFTLLRVLRQAFSAMPTSSPLSERLRRLPGLGFMSWP